MLSVFPSLLTWSQLSPFLIRLTLGAVFVFWTYGVFKRKPADKIIGIIGGIAGILLVIGLYTQIAALVATLIMLVCLVEKIKKSLFFNDGVNYYFLLLIMALSLLFTGAGFWAFDLPL